MGIYHHHVAEDRPGFYVPRRAAVAHEQQEDIRMSSTIEEEWLRYLSVSSYSSI